MLNKIIFYRAYLRNYLNVLDSMGLYFTTTTPPSVNSRKPTIQKSEEKPKWNENPEGCSKVIFNFVNTLLILNYFSCYIFINYRFSSSLSSL